MTIFYRWVATCYFPSPFGSMHFHCNFPLTSDKSSRESEFEIMLSQPDQLQIRLSKQLSIIGSEYIPHSLRLPRSLTH